MRTLLIIDKAKHLEHGTQGYFYINEQGEEIRPSPTSTITYLRFSSKNIIDLTAEIALLKAQIRKGA